MHTESEGYEEVDLKNPKLQSDLLNFFCTCGISDNVFNNLCSRYGCSANVSQNGELQIAVRQMQCIGLLRCWQLCVSRCYWCVFLTNKKANTHLS